jgi:dimethylaniline monooxygenase (N-oxide forming)
VIGGGETASDLCNEVSYVAKTVYLSIPNGQWFGGRFNQHWAYNSAWPLDNFSSRFRRYVLDGNPDPEKFEAMKVWAEKYDGAFGHGFDCWKSPYEVYGQAIINKSNDVLRRAVLGRVIPKGKMERMEGRTVYFEDGTKAENIDLIYFATGYRLEFPFLEKLGRRFQCVSKQFKLCLDNRDDSLGFVGFARPIRGSFPSISESAARYLAHLWSGKVEMIPQHERERITRLDTIDRNLFFTAFDKFGYTKKCPETGGLARANARAAGLVDLFGYADDMATLSGVMPNYTRILFECGLKKWIIAILAPHHQAQYMLNDPSRRDYVFDRFLYFLTRFPILIPIIFSIFNGWYHQWKAYLRNRFMWTAGYLFVKRPHPTAVHIWELKADLRRQRAALCRKDALKDVWPGSEDASCSACSSGVAPAATAPTPVKTKK